MSFKNKAPGVVIGWALTLLIDFSPHYVSHPGGQGTDFTFPPRSLSDGHISTSLWHGGYDSGQGRPKAKWEKAELKEHRQGMV